MALDNNATLTEVMDNFYTINTTLQSKKDAIASVITSKGVSASGTESFDSLKNKIDSLKKPQIVLFDSGNLCTSVTGGWTGSVSSNKLVVTTATQTIDKWRSSIFTKNKINTSGYKYLHATVSYTGPASTCMCIFSICSGNTNAETQAIAKHSVTGTSFNGLLTIPVSSQNGYVGFFVYTNSSTTASVANITKVWLES